MVLVPIPTVLPPNPLASPLGGVGIGGRPPGPTLWSFMHHAILLSSCCCFLSMLLGGVGDVLILASYQESPCEFSSATHPWGTNPFLIGTLRARLDYDYACKYTRSIFLVPFYHNMYIVSIYRPGVWKFVIVLLLYSVLLKGRRRSH